MSSELFGNQGSKPAPQNAAPKDASKEAPKQEAPKTASTTKSTETKPADTTQEKPSDHNDPNKVAGSETKPSSAPSSLVPAAPLQGEQPAEQNKEAVQTGSQPTSNPAQNQTPAQNADQNASDEDDDPDPLPTVDELTMLKERAKLMGITHSNNIGVDALREKIAKKIAGEDDEAEKAQTKEENLADRSNVTGEDPETATLILNPQESKKLTVRQHVIQENMKLIRLRITNLDPKKKDLPGEIITVANEFLGTVRKYIPFGEVTDNGWHVPYCLYEMLRDRQFVNIKTRKGPKGEVIVEHQWAKEFALEVLEPLTSEELARLSASQMAAGGIE